MWQQLRKFNLQIMTSIYTHFYPTEIVPRNTQRKCWLPQHLLLALQKFSTQWLIDRFHWVPLTWATPCIEPASFYRFYPTQIAKTSAKFHSHAKQIYTYPAIVRIFAPGLPFVVVAGHRTAVVLRCAAPFAAYLPFRLFFYSLPLPFSMGNNTANDFETGTPPYLNFNAQYWFDISQNGNSKRVSLL